MAGENKGRRSFRRGAGQRKRTSLKGPKRAWHSTKTVTGKTKPLGDLKCHSRTPKHRATARFKQDKNMKELHKKTRTILKKHAQRVFEKYLKAEKEYQEYIKSQINRKLFPNG